jgi:Ser/Thr protein kinase RdoA (MazF antagonist)
VSEPGAEAEGAHAVPEVVVHAYRALDAGFETIEGGAGLIHRTLHLRTRDGREFVLQRVSEVFAPGIHENIERVGAHLRSRGVPCLALEPTREGRCFLDLGPQGRWRLMTRLDGVSFDRAQSAAQIESASELVGRFHRALDDFREPLEPMGLPFRDTAHYRAQLAAALAAHADGEERHAVAALHEALEAGFERLGAPPRTASRVIHGDLKISNVLFASREPPGRDRAVALIDLDTLMRAPLWCEWGDAWRSWCNVRDEDALDARFDFDVFEASLRGFRAGYGRGLDAAERASLVDATERLALELAVRYATDALEQRYFAWDRERFSSAHAHNLRRARGQLALFEAARAARSRRAAVIDVALG